MFVETAVGIVWATIVKILGYFLFLHLVTLCESNKCGKYEEREEQIIFTDSKEGDFGVENARLIPH